jgi:hypothetical protein
MTEGKTGDNGDDIWDKIRSHLPVTFDYSGRKATAQKQQESKNSSVPINQNRISSNDEVEDDSKSSYSSSIPSRNHGKRSSSSSDIDESTTSPVLVHTEKQKIEKCQNPQMVSSKDALTGHSSNSSLGPLRYEIKPPTPKDSKLYVVQCTWCDCKMTENWRQSFLNVKRDMVYGTSILCPGCVQSHEIIQELSIECKFCKLPPPHLGEAPGGGFTCEDCSIMRGLLPFKRRTTFKTRGPQKGHPIGTVVHLVRMNVGGGGFEEVTEGS